MKRQGVNRLSNCLKRIMLPRNRSSSERRVGILPILSLLIVVFLLISSADAYAVTRTWVGGGTNRWTTAANWTPTGTPGAGDVIVFNNTVACNITNTTTTVASINTTGYTGTITQTGNVSVSGTVTHAGGTWSRTSGSSTITIGGDLTFGAVGGSASTTMNLSGSTGAVTITGNVTFLANTSGTNTLTMGTQTLSFGKTWDSSDSHAVFTCNGSTVTSTAASSTWYLKVSASYPFNILTKTGAGTLDQSYNDIVANKGFTLSAGNYYQTGGGGNRKLTVGGAFLINGTGVFYKSTAAPNVVLNAGAAQNLTSRTQNLGNVRISTASTNVSTLDALTCESMTIDGSTTLTQGAFPITVNTDWWQSGTFTQAAAAPNNVSITGSLGLLNGTWTHSSGTSTVTVGGNLNIGTASDATTSTMNFGTSTGAINVTGSVLFLANTSGTNTLTLNSNTLTYGQDWNSTDSHAVFNCGTSTVISNAADTRSFKIRSPSSTYPFYIFQKTGAGDLYMESDIKVNNNMTVSNGNFLHTGASGNWTLTVGGNLNFSSTGTWTQLGNVAVTGDINLTNGHWNCSSGAWTVDAANLYLGTASGTASTAMDFTGSSGAITITYNVGMLANTSGTNTLTLDSNTLTYGSNWDTWVSGTDATAVFNRGTSTVISTATSVVVVKDKASYPFYIFSKTGNGAIYSDYTGLTAKDNFTLSAGDFYLNGGGGDQTLTVGGDLLINGTGLFHKNLSTTVNDVVLNGGVAQSLTSRGQAMGKIEIETAGTNVSLQDALGCDTMTIDASTTLTQGANAITVGTDWWQSGTFIQATNTPSNVTITSNLNLLNGTWTHSSGTSTISVGADLKIGTLSGTTSSTMNLSGSSGAITVTNNVNFLANTSGTNTLTMGSNTLSYGLNWNSEATTSVFNCGNSTVINTAASPNIVVVKTLAGQPFYIFSKTGTDDLYTDYYDMAVTNNFTLSGGNFYLSGGGGNRKLTVGGNLLINGTGVFNKGASAPDVVLNGGGAQSLTSRGQAMGDIKISTAGTNVSLQDALGCDSMTIDPSATLTQGAYNITLGGNWTNNGTASLSGSGTAAVIFDTAGNSSTIAGSTSFFNLTCTTANKTLLFALDPAVTSITNNLTITGTNGNNIILGPSPPTTYEWLINPAGTKGGTPGWSVDYVTVSYSRNEAATPILPAHYTDLVSNSTNNWFSSVTMVKLSSFYAIGYFGKVELYWKTESEFNNAGFNILRSEDGKNYTNINPGLIKGLGTPILGQEYTYEDAGVVDGKTYYYLLEDIETTGKATKHGPVAARPGLDADKDGLTDDWENYHGLNPLDASDANIVSGSDGLTNLQEFQSAANPSVANSQNAAGASGTGGVNIIESAGLRTVLELDTSTLKVTDRNEGGIVYQLITLPEYICGQTTDVGKPQIPTKGILLGTLNKKPVTINILESEKETYPGYNIYPVPKAVLNEDPNDPAIKRLSYEFYKDANAYAIDAFYPGLLADADYSNYLQGQQVIKVIFYPIQFNPVTGTLDFYKKIKLEVLQEGADLGATVAAVTPKTAVPLTAATAYKIYINENGIYRLTRPYLESQGISLSDIDPRNLKIYNQGAEIPIYVSGEGDGQFGASDYIEFYGQAVDTRYTGTNVYWLVLSDEPGLRMSASGQVEDATVTPGSFIETYKGEDNALYWQEATGEDHWFIDAIYGSQVYSLYLNLNGVANSADEATVNIALEGSADSGAEFTHHVYARLNGYPIADASWQGATDYTINSSISQSYLNEGANTVTLEVGADPTGFEEILVNWVEVSYRKNFTAKDNVLAFGNYTGGAYKYQISGFTNQDVEVYDITDSKNVQRVTQLTVLPEDGTFAASFKDAGSKDYIVLTQDKAKAPAGIVRYEPSNLADKKNKADYIIITHEDFYDTILPFADYRSNQGLKVKVVKLGDIYDEFNYGIADVHAVKDFLKYAYNNWTGGKPNYVLLVGDATYDYRDYSGYGFTNYVPTYLVKSLTFGETGSDNWFVCFDGDNDVIPDMLIGRFPIKTTDELKSMIDRIIAYEAISPDEAWTKKVLLVADNDEKIFTDTSEELTSYLTAGYSVDKQYLGTTTNDPAALKQSIINSINGGRLFVNYTGHGGIGLWASERLFTWDDINSLYNRNMLPVITTLTCADGYFVYPRYIESLGQRLVNDANGGAIATLVPSGISLPTTQAYLAEGFYGAYFKDKDAILGSLVAKGKLNVYENASGDDAANVIQTFNLFGDPALRVRMKAPQIPAVAAPEVFNLNKDKVNGAFRLTAEPGAAQAAAAGAIVINKGNEYPRGLTKIIREAEAAPVESPSTKGSLESKVPEEKGPGIRGVQMEEKTAATAPPKWRVLSKAEYGALKAAKPYVNIDYSFIKKGVTNINQDASQLAELKMKFDKAVKENDLQKASSIFRDITKLARKIYWRTL